MRRLMVGGLGVVAVAWALGSIYRRWLVTGFLHHGPRSSVFDQ